MPKQSRWFADAAVRLIKRLCVSTVASFELNIRAIFLGSRAHHHLKLVIQSSCSPCLIWT